MSAVQAQQHPCVYVSPADRASVLQKVKNEPWAGEAFAAIRSKVEKYVDRHQTDPEWITFRLAMYWKDGERYTQCYLKKQNWDYGEGNAPVPTVPSKVYCSDDYPLPEGRSNLAQEVFHHLETGEPVHYTMDLNNNLWSAAMLDAGIRSSRSLKMEEVKTACWTIG